MKYSTQHHLLISLFVTLVFLFGVTLWSLVTSTRIQHFFTTSQNISNQVLADPIILQTHVENITDTQLPRNHQNLDELNSVADYIADHFHEFCPQVDEQTFTVNHQKYRNIICTFGESNNIKVIGAHYDVHYESIGADDNASGVAGILELARLLSTTNTDQNITLIAYTLEEPPHFRTKYMGSYQHAEYLARNSITLEYMISLEMIGYFSDMPNSQYIPSRALKLIYPSTANFIALIGRFGNDAFISELKRTYNSSTQLPAKALHAPDYMLTGYSSDQLNYWAFGYNAAIITDTGPFRNKNYHKVSDTSDTLDYQKMAEVINGVYLFVQN